MKKLLAIFALLVLTLPSYALTVDNTKDGGAQAMVNKIGFRLLNANAIPYRTTFTLKPDKKIVNAYATYGDKSIVVYGGIILVADNEDEIAAIISHEISHIVDYNQGILRGYFSIIPSSFKPRKYEFMADKRAVDYMVKGGYNPIAFITMMNKISNQTRYEWYLTHPTGSRRLAAAYEYIYTKYPQYLVQNEYKDNLYYQNFLLTSRENRLKLQKKVQDKSKKSINYL